MNADNYKNRMPYPDTADYTVYNVYQNGKVLGSSLDWSQKNDLKAQYPNAIIEKIVNTDGLKKAREEYNAEEKAQIERFWQDFADEEGIDINHPKFELLKEIAWDRGHSHGLDEVYSQAEGLAEFLK